MATARAKQKASGKTLAERIRPRLRPGTAQRTKARMAELTAAAAAVGAGEAVAGALARPELAPLIAGVMDCAPFLRGLILDDPTRLARLLGSDPAARMRRLTGAIGRAWKTDDAESLMATLRRGRQEAALLTALADLGGVWDVVQVTGALTAFAEAAVGAAVRFVLTEAAAAGKIALANAQAPEEGSGWIVLGMGKFGAGELNYSSDIDLIVLFDEAVARMGADVEPSVAFVRMTQRLVALLQEHTADGYVFRTDLRLRPDPGSTNVAMSAEAALQYYESLGQNWERAALIKARPVAGDRPAGDAFLAELTPLYLAQVSRFRRHRRHPLDQAPDPRPSRPCGGGGRRPQHQAGRGGIREIEFFVQTQQLIAGGRQPELRGRRTLDMLKALAEFGWIDSATRDELSAAYGALRTVEHCLQMIDDAQTHTLPEDAEGLAVVARMAGFRNTAAFQKAVVKTLTTVRDRYAALFEKAPSLTSAAGSLSFTGDTDDPETLATLSALGYSNPAEISHTIRGWHFGRYAAMRSASARERLTEFVPVLLEALAGGENADAAFAAFDRFLARMPAGVQLFSLLQTNSGLLNLLVTVLAAAPRLAETIVRRTHVMDALLDPAFFGSVPDAALLRQRLAEMLSEARDFEDVLDRARIFGQEQQFLIGVRVLADTISVRQAGYAYSDLADALVSAVLDATLKEFERAHGKMKRGAVALVAMGKLGGREMSATSDVDLILLYDFDEAAASSSGPRPLHGSQYYTRLTQRLVAALSAPTAEGTLYAVDFRLRPSGKSGPLATHIEAFAAYQAKDAWTWERMAMTRARIVAGDRKLAKRAGGDIHAILTARRDSKKIIADIREMRAMVEDAKGGEGAWDIKQAPGGLVDIEFIAQALLLVNAHRCPALISTETEAMLAAAASAGLLSPADADILLPAQRLYSALIQIIRLCLDTPFDPETAPRALLDRLARAGELPDFATLEAHLKATEEAVRAIFQRLIGPVLERPPRHCIVAVSDRACPAAFREVRHEACLAWLPGNRRGVRARRAQPRLCRRIDLAVQSGRRIGLPRRGGFGRQAGRRELSLLHELCGHRRRDDGDLQRRSQGARRIDRQGRRAVGFLPARRPAAGRRRRCGCRYPLRRDVGLLAVHDRRRRLRPDAHCEDHQGRGRRRRPATAGQGSERVAAEAEGGLRRVAIDRRGWRRREWRRQRRDRQLKQAAAGRFQAADDC